MKKIYICSPVKGDHDDLRDIERNIAKAEIYSKTVYKLGHLPICPHIYLERATGLKETKDQTSRDILLNLGLELLVGCDELWVFGRTRGIESNGMKKEIEYARTNNISISYRTEYLLEPKDL